MRTPDGMNFIAPIANIECPGCRLNWWLNPPVKIDGQNTEHRCIECKRVFEFGAIEIIRSGQNVATYDENGDLRISRVR